MIDQQKPLTQKASTKNTYVNFHATRWALSVTFLSLPSRSSTLLRLAQHADDFGCSFLSAGRLASEVGVDRRTIRRCMGDLEAARLVRRIGRVGGHGGQVSNVSVLIGWPGRKPIPMTGHPKLGRTIKESLVDALNQWASTRKTLPRGEDTISHQNNSSGIINTATATEPATRSALLKGCLDALWDWATEANRRRLIDDFDQLELYLKDGADLNSHILPTLRMVGRRRKIPQLRSWEYFREMIYSRVSATAKMADTCSPEPLPVYDQPDSFSEPNGVAFDPSISKGNTANDPGMTALLRRLAKRGPLVD